MAQSTPPNVRQRAEESGLPAGGKPTLRETLKGRKGSKALEFADKLRERLEGEELLEHISRQAIQKVCFGKLDFAERRLDLRGNVNDDSSSEEEEEEEDDDAAAVLSHSSFVAVRGRPTGGRVLAEIALRRWCISPPDCMTLLATGEPKNFVGLDPSNTGQVLETRDSRCPLLHHWRPRGGASTDSSLHPGSDPCAH